ncbi:glycosyltransferase [Blastococcus deserti]|uniref:Glycosyltransferase n=1 Tax=Blastococcus deserti TaxID=2259033 RepID=A0ABW4XFW7_9ACTN
MNIVVTGWVAPFPTPAYFWHSMGFLLGFRDLGHEVWFLEDSGDHPWGWDIANDRPDPECRTGADVLDRQLRALGLGDRWTFRHIPSGRHHGMGADQVADVLADADVLVNVSLMTPMRGEYLQVPNRLAIDTDPVFTQVRIANGDPTLAQVPGTHTRLFTFGRPPLPGQLHEWLPTRQAVSLRHWEVPPPPDRTCFSTITTWQAYEPVVWEGRRYAAKDVSWEEYLDLPAKVRHPLVVAMGGRGAKEGTATLSARGWHVRTGTAVSTSERAYRAFIEGSTGELSLAKHGYVSARSGWFSERTCAYLAMGRPAVVQDTGWGEWLPSGEGLLPFSTPSEAVAALEEVASDPHRHASAARRIAEEHFSAPSVCADLLRRL